MYLKKFVWDYVIRNVDTQRIEYKGQRMLTEMFQIFESDPERLLPRNTANRWRNALKKGRSGLFAIILQACRMHTHCGYINNFDLERIPSN